MKIRLLQTIKYAGIYHNPGVELDVPDEIAETLLPNVAEMVVTASASVPAPAPAPEAPKPQAAAPGKPNKPVLTKNKRRT